MDRVHIVVNTLASPNSSNMCMTTAKALHDAAAQQGLKLGRGGPGVLTFVPPLDVAVADLRGPVADALDRAVDATRKVIEGA